MRSAVHTGLPATRLVLPIIGLVLGSPAALPAAADGPTLPARAASMGGLLPPEQRAVEMDHLDLALKVDPERRRIEGVATLTLRTTQALDVLSVDLFPDYGIHEVSIDGNALDASAWSHPGGELRMQLPARTAAGQLLRVSIEYAGSPHVTEAPPWEGGLVWSQDQEGQPWIGSSLWGGGCDLLWPCIDHPARRPQVADIRITVPNPLVAPANGVLVDITEADGWHTYHWRATAPHSYGIAVTAGAYEVLEGRYESHYCNSIPLFFWHLPEHAAKAKDLFLGFAPMIEFMEQRIGPYPWPGQKFGVVEVPFRGMENQTINAYGNGYSDTPYGFDEVLQHEFTHEYFGNQMSAADFDDLWLHEGFATYMQPLYAEHLLGQPAYRALLEVSRSQIRNAFPLVTGKTRDVRQVFSEDTGPLWDLYHKGSLVLHMLRGLVGDEAFFEALRTLVFGQPDPSPGNFSRQLRTTPDFIRIVESASGQELSWFFDVYLYRASLPVLTQSRNGDRLLLTWQAPDGLPFPMPVEVLIGDELVVVPMTGNRGEVRVPPEIPVRIDPASNLLFQ